MPGWTVPATTVDDLVEVVRSTPVPFRGQGYASLPRFRAEIGPFVGIASGVIAEGADGGFSANREGGAGGLPRPRAAARLRHRRAARRFGRRAGLRPGRHPAAVPVHRRLRDGLPVRPDPLPVRSGSARALRVELPAAGAVLADSGRSASGRSDPRVRQPQAAREDGDRVRRRGPDSVADEAGDADRVAAVRGGARDVRQPLRIPGRQKTPSSRSRGTRRTARRSFSPSPSGRSSGTFRSLELRPLREYGTRYSFSTLVQFGAGFDTPFDAQSLIPGQPVPPLKTRVFRFRADLLRRAPVLLAGDPTPSGRPSRAGARCAWRWAGGSRRGSRRSRPSDRASRRAGPRCRGARCPA